SKTYIEISNNFLYQLIQDIGIIILLFISNFIFVFIYIKPNAKNHSSLKKIGTTVLIVIIEMIFWLSYFMICGNFSLLPGNEAFSFSLFLGVLFQIFRELSFWLLAIVFITNIYAIPIVLKIKSQPEPFNLSDWKITKEFVGSLLVTLLIVMALFLPGSYIMGIMNENKKTNYKVIIEPINTAISEATQYNVVGSDKIFVDKYVENFNVNNLYRLYAVIYENKDVYILSSLYKKDENFYIDKTSQKIIAKQEINTYLFSNILK
ncbi:MAG: hypothetical protein PWP30_963, partial [Eubacteriaceae bacterium]|nr:hypothetical protein [Eubacteriaceae bacterium]